MRIKITAWLCVAQGLISGLLTTLLAYAYLPTWSYWWAKMDGRPGPDVAYFLQKWGPPFSWLFVIMPVFMAFRITKAKSLETCVEVIAIEALRTAAQITFFIVLVLILVLPNFSLVEVIRVH
jgi:hypothetical protein